jgi:hypothetical protein
MAEVAEFLPVQFRADNRESAGNSGYSFGEDY